MKKMNKMYEAPKAEVISLCVNGALMQDYPHGGGPTLVSSGGEDEL